MTGSMLLERLARGPILCAEGYLFELERRGYLQAGAYVPEVVLDRPEAVEQLHREFVHAGSDVVEAFTYYGHREKLRLIGKEHLLEPLNRDALAIAGRVARETGTLLAGDVCNTNLYREEPGARRAVRAMFDEQVAWAAEAGVDFVIAETFQFARRGAAGDGGDPGGRARGGRHAGDPPRPADARGLDAGGGVQAPRRRRRGGRRAQLHPRPADDAAAAAGGPRGRRRAGRGAARPVPHARGRADVPVARRRRGVPDRARPLHLDPPRRRGLRRATALEIGVAYLGLCCGAAPHHIRAMAEAMGRRPPASRYSPDMSKHAYLGSDPSLQADNLAFAERL